MATTADRLKNALQGATRKTDPAKIWRDTFAEKQIQYEHFRRVVEHVQSVPAEVIQSILDNAGKTAEEQFHAAQPEYISIEDVRNAWKEQCDEQNTVAATPRETKKDTPAK